MHHSWTWKGGEVEKGGLDFEPMLELNNGEGWNNWGTTVVVSGGQLREAQEPINYMLGKPIGYRRREASGDNLQGNWLQAGGGQPVTGLGNW